MEKKKLEMKLPSIDDLFEPVDTKEIVRSIPINKIDEFKDHPFQVRNDEEMRKLAKSIKQHGVLNPILVRPKTDGRYEIVSGHRRKRASEMVRLLEIPVIIRELTDEEATILMVDSNLQREKILPSEKAFAYKMKLEAIKHQGKKTSSAPLEHKQENAQTSRDLIAKEQKESREQIRRYIRLTDLIPEILKMVDREQIAFRPAVEISYLSHEQQKDLLSIMQYLEATPSLSQAIKLKKLSQENKLSVEKIDEIVGEDKPNQIPRIKLNQQRLQKILPQNIKTDEQVENFIIACIKEHNQRKKSKDCVR